MAADQKFEFLVDKTNGTLTIRRAFAAGQQLVWDCHTKRELLDQWFAPKPLSTKTKHMDFRSGGYWHYAMITQDGDEYWNRLDYQSVSPISGYIAKDGFCDAAGTVNPDMPRSHWTVSFAAAAAGITTVTTEVVYTSADDLQKSIDMGLEGGMASTMERLDELLPRLTA